jgi:hypothetical protein
MTKTARKAAVSAAVVTAVLGWTSTAAMAKSLNADGQPTAIVRVDNEASVPAGELQFAEARAAEIFRQIGIRVTWVDRETAIREDLYPPYTVVVMAARPWHEDGGQQLLVDSTLGLAAPSAHRAHVYYDRVAAVQVGAGLRIGCILGDVIAHELGHLLLPPPSHSFTGIMRPNIPFETLIETFNEAQARQIRSRLRQAP